MHGQNGRKRIMTRNVYTLEWKRKRDSPEFSYTPAHTRFSFLFFFFFLRGIRPLMERGRMTEDWWWRKGGRGESENEGLGSGCADSSTLSSISKLDGRIRFSAHIHKYRETKFMHTYTYIGTFIHKYIFYMIIHMCMCSCVYVHL